MGPACSICRDTVVEPKVLLDDDDDDTGDEPTFRFRQGRQCRYVSVAMEDPPTPSRSSHRTPLELARQTLSTRPLCMERYASYLGEARAVEFTAAVACIALHCRGSFLSEIETGKQSGPAMQQTVVQAFRPILQVVKEFGGDVVSVPSDRPTIFVVWDQSNAEEFLDTRADASVAPCTTPHEALFAAISCLLALRQCLPTMEHFQSLQTLVTFGEVTLQSPWGLHAPSLLLSGKPIRALSTILDQSFATDVILHRDSWALIKEWCVHVPSPNHTAPYVEVTALRRPNILAPAVWAKVRPSPSASVEMGQPTSVFLPLSVPPVPRTPFPGTDAPSLGSPKSSQGDWIPAEALVADVATLSKVDLSPSLKPCPVVGTSFLQQHATVFSMALPHTRLSADTEGAILPQFLRTMCHLVTRNGGKLVGLCQWRQYLLLTAVFYADGGAHGPSNDSCLNALRTCLYCAREAGLAQPLFTVTSGCIFVLNFMHERRLVSVMGGRPFTWWLGLVSMPDFGERVIWCDAETKLLAGGHFQVRALDSLRKPLCWGLRHTVDATQELSFLQVLSVREHLALCNRLCAVRRQARSVLDEYVMAVIKAGTSPALLKQGVKAAPVNTVHLWGSAQMGKSIVLAAVHARWAVFPVFFLHCAENEEQQAFAAVRHLLGGIFAWLKSSSAFPGHLPAHKVQEFVQGCATGMDRQQARMLDYVLPGRFRGQAEPEEQPTTEADMVEEFSQTDIVPAVCGVLQTLCGAMQCLVVFIDDAHYMDAESHAVFREMHQWAVAGRQAYLQVFGANRMLMARPMLEPSSSYTLPPLASSEVQAVLEDRLQEFLWDGEHVAPEVILSVEAVTRSHPLLVTHLADHLAATVTQVEPQEGKDGLTLDAEVLKSIQEFTFSRHPGVCQVITRLYNSLSTDQKKVVKIAAVFVSSQRYSGVCWELLRAMFPAGSLARFEVAFTALIDGGILIARPGVSLVQGWLSYHFALGPMAEVLALKVPSTEVLTIRIAMFHEIQQCHAQLTAHPNSYLCWASFAVYAGRQELVQSALRMAEAACPVGEDALLQEVQEERAALLQQLEATTTRQHRLSQSSVSSILMPFTPPHRITSLLQGKTGSLFRRKKALVKTGMVEIDGLLKRLSTLATRMWQHGVARDGLVTALPTKLLRQLQQLEALEATIAMECPEHVECQTAISSIRNLIEGLQPHDLRDPGKMQNRIWDQLREFAQQCTDLFGTRAKALLSDPLSCSALWTSEFSVHVDPVVEHHQELLYLLRQLLGSMRQSSNKGTDFRAVSATLMHLAEVLLDTFRMEESVMCLLRYPKLCDHAATHRSFLLQVVDLQAQLQVESEGLEYELCLLLFQWFTSHLQVSDREFALWVEANFGALTYAEVCRHAVQSHPLA
eukprot:GGOE01018408.1.p1 GENE.GGOE01018408.1~~GGOE01018408.1.p1  ORF type:complete len:1393 (+),score=446.73 GGOE01018408.1:65-4243(+)